MQRARFKQTAGLVVGASLLASTLGVGASAFAFSGNPHYYDIAKLTPLAQRAAVTLYQDGIMNGTAPGKFSPYGQITRAQSVKFIVNALRLPLDSTATETYTDVTRFSQYYPYIEAAVKAGILTGMAPASGDFNPSAIITRVDFAVLATNALGDQPLAQSLAHNTTKYGYLRDLGTVPAADLGDVNAMMEVGIVPPYNKVRFAPFNKMNREEFAVAIMRLYNVLAARNLTAAALAAAKPVVGVGQTDQLTVTAQNASGQTFSAGQLSQYTVAYSVTGANSASATVTPNGAFVATAPGTYTVDVSISGNGLTSPVVASTQIQVFGSPAALKVMPKSSTIVADKAATDTVQVEVVDSSGSVVGDYSGPVTLTDTNSATELVGTNGNPQSAAMTVNAQNGVATFTIQSTTGNPGASDTLAANASTDGHALTAASAVVTTVAQKATSVQVTAASNDLRANEGGNQDAIRAVVDDQAGSPMLTGTYALTFSLTGPAAFTDGATTMPQAFIADGTANPPPAQADIVSQQGATGAIAVTVGGPNLTSGTTTVQSVIAGSPQAMKLSAASSSVASGAADAITVQLVDSHGNPTTTASAIAVSASISLSGKEVGTLTGTIAAGGGSTVLNFSEAATGTYVVTVSAAGFPAASVTVAVTSGQASSLALSPSGAVNGAPLDLAQGHESVQVTAQLVDSNGNAVSQSGIPIVFSASGGSGSYSVNGVAGGTTVDTGANGTAQATFDFGDSTGTWTVQAASGLATVRQTFQIVAYTASAVDVHINQPSPATAGETISGVITAQQPNGTADNNADYIQVAVSPEAGLEGVTFTNPASAGAKLTPISAQSGVYLVKSSDGQIDFTATAGQAGTVTVKATDESVASPVSGSASIGINASSVPGGAAAYDSQGNNLGTTPLTVGANQAVPVTVRLTDGYGNAVVSNVPVTVVLQDLNGTANAGGAFRSSSQGADYPNNEITLPAGSPGVVVYYVNAAAGSYTINALTPGLMTGASSQAGSAAGQGTIMLAFGNLPSGGTITADTNAADWTVDVNGQALPSSAYSIAASGKTVVFTLASGYVSGKPFSVAPTGANTSRTNAGVALSIPSAAFSGQSLG